MIEFLSRDKIAAVPLLHHIAEREGVEAVIVAIRIDGKWTTAWSTNTCGGLAMGAMKVFRDVSDNLEEQ